MHTVDTTKLKAQFTEDWNSNGAPILSRLDVWMSGRSPIRFRVIRAEPRDTRVRKVVDLLVADTTSRVITLGVHPKHGEVEYRVEIVEQDKTVDFPGRVAAVIQAINDTNSSYGVYEEIAPAGGEVLKAQRTPTKTAEDPLLAYAQSLDAQLVALRNVIKQLTEAWQRLLDKQKETTDTSHGAHLTAADLDDDEVQQFFKAHGGDLWE